jgi:Leucine-rich repeat (LRR) protein
MGTYRKTLTLLFSIILLFFITLFIVCEKKPEGITSDKGKNLPIANAGPDQTTFVGSYVIIDVSASTAGDSSHILWWEITEDSSNPVSVRPNLGRSSGNDMDSFIGFIKEGIYRFYVVVSNGPQTSEPDEVVITVKPRQDFIFEDPVLEIYTRFVLKMPEGELTDPVLESMDSLYNYTSPMLGQLTSIKGIEHCTNLTYLSLGLERISDLSSLTNLIKLTYLDLTQNRNIKDVSPLAELTQLRCLYLDSNDISDISPLANLTQLEYLDLQLNENISDISAIANMENLQNLVFFKSVISDISPLRNLKRLIFLDLPDCQISDISPLENLTNLQYLNLRWNHIADISAVAGMVHLERLYLHDNEIVDISPLENLVNINWILLSRNHIIDILPLVNNPGLGNGDAVNLRDNPLNEISINEYIPQLQNRGVLISWP